MFDSYLKLFDITWIEAWMVEAMAIVLAALLLSFVVCKVNDCMTGDK